METQNAWIDDRLPTEDDVNEHGHIIKPDRHSEKGWYVSDTQGIELGNPWARIHTMPIWVPSEEPDAVYWNKPSDFPRLCWMMSADSPDCFLMCHPSYFLDGRGPHLSIYRWMERPFNRFSEGSTCTK